ncbi:MAG: roadblock/LC7 domain-containing protein [Myxococcales bacterium]|nr:roadblock/LC7 domain-containing protein [Myxococcales bacterium]
MERVPGAHAAALVDAEGETVDYAGDGEPFHLRVAAAHWKIVLEAALRQSALAGLEWMSVRSSRRSFLVTALPDGYALVVLLARAAGFAGWSRALDHCRRSLAREAGWAPRSTREVAPPRWLAVDVVCDDRGRPRSIRLAEDEGRVDIIGALASPAPGPSRSPASGPSRRERAWRVRLESGLEATLVREAGDFWYLDDALVTARPPNKPQGSRGGTRVRAGPRMSSRKSH